MPERLRITRRIVKRSGDSAAAFKPRFGMTPREYRKRHG
jgi:AraC-like DNA-binding protein